MRMTATCVIALFLAGTAVAALAQISAPKAPPVRGSSTRPPVPPGPHPDSQYRLGPDSLPQEGVPKGEIRGPFTLPSRVFPGTQHT